METELNANYDSRKSFYGKATVIHEEGVIKLRSYSTIVAEIRNGKPIVFGTYSNTTLRHIKEFLKQNGFLADDIKDVRNYFPSKEKEELKNSEEEKKARSMFDSLKMVCKMGEIFTEDQKSLNDWNKRMLSAGLENKGLRFPQNWETLTEEEKSRRIKNTLEVLK